MTSVALLSHRFGNIGHNFMALGAGEAAREAFGPTVELSFFEQHHPFAVYPEGHWLRFVDRLPHGRMRWIRRQLAQPKVYERLWRQTKELRFDLAVACGGPNIVPGASRPNAPELQVMLLHFNGAFQFRGVPLVDAAVGSAFPLTRIPERLDAPDEKFYRRALSYVAEITVREHEAQRVLSTLGVSAKKLPCIAIGSGRTFERWNGLRRADAPGKVAINFQAKGSNDDWGQGVDPDAWRKTCRRVIDTLRDEGEDVFLLCHSSYEVRLAKQVAPELPVIFPQTEQQYASAIREVKFGFVSRIHAAIALAGIGAPSVVVGNDTRTGTTKEIGLPTLFALKTNYDEIMSCLRVLSADLQAEQERLIALRESTMQAYAGIFRTHARS